jgi:diguanylate cyclase (GGDEF)-like protein/PAS domain S-box-containing protein
MADNRSRRKVTVKPLKQKDLYRLILLMLVATVPCIAGTFLYLRYLQGSTIASSMTGRSMRHTGDRLMDASDLLTEEVRAFSATGDRSRLFAYWQEADVVRSRDQAMLDISGLGLPSGEVAHMASARRASEELMDLEIRAMRLRAAADAIPASALPARLAAYRLSAEDAALDPEAKRGLALRLLYSTEYEESKRRIRSSVDEFRSAAARRVEGTIAAAQRRAQTALILLAAALALLVASSVYIGGLAYTQLARPMQEYMRLLSSPSPDGRLPELVPFGGEGPRKLAGILNVRREEIIRYQTELMNAKLRSDSYFQFLPLAAVETSNENVVTLWNPAAERLFGYLASEAVGKNIVDLLVTDAARSLVLDFIERLKLHDGIDDHVNPNRTKAGKDILCEWCNTPIFDADGNRTGWISVVRDVTEERLEAEQILYLARHDPLTGLLNRRHLTERINEEIARVRRTERHFALVMVDIDFFKTFNDAYGHDCGDAVLVKISGAILRSVRKTDSVGRWGGEEFLVLLPETSYHGAGKIAEKIRREVERLVVRHEGKDLRVTVTAGFAACGGGEIDECVKSADQALLRGKAEGRNRSVGA